MKERPLLMSGPLVVATINGLKTQTRRVMNPQPLHTGPIVREGDHFLCGVNWIWCPHGVPGDRLWIREAFSKHLAPGGETTLQWRADGMWRVQDWKGEPQKGAIDPEERWTPSIHMPRRYSRLVLEITEVRAQRLQDISEEDANAEGIPKDKLGWFLGPDGAQHSRATCVFGKLWDSINDKRLVGGKPIRWIDNPWVWAITYRVAELYGKAV